MVVQRITSIDMLRGGLLVAMMLFHLNFLLRDVFNLPFFYNHGIFEELFQICIGSGFLILAGFCSQYFQGGRTLQIRRIMLLGISSALLSGITLGFIPQFPVQFGILHCFFLLAVVDLIPQLSSIRWQFPLFIFLFGSTFFLPLRWGESILGVPFGIIPEQFYSIDYYPIVPWAVCYFLGKLLAQCRWFPRNLISISQIRIGFLEWLGKNSLFVYCVHIPIFYLLVLCVSIRT